MCFLRQNHAEYVAQKLENVGQLEHLSGVDCGVCLHLACSGKPGLFVEDSAHHSLWKSFQSMLASRSIWPDWYAVNGADDVVTKSKYRASAQNRMICLGREPHTREVRDKLRRYEVNPYHYIVLCETCIIPCNVSSTAVRQCLATGDMDLLKTLVDPPVFDYLLQARRSPNSNGAGMSCG